MVFGIYSKNLPWFIGKITSRRSHSLEVSQKFIVQQRAIRKSNTTEKKCKWNKITTITSQSRQGAFSGVARPSFLGGRSERQGCPKNFFRNNLFFTTSSPPPPPRRQKSFGQCTILGVQNFFRTSQCHCDQKYEIAFPHSQNCVAFSYDTE